MKGQEMARLTNIWSKVFQQDGRQVSRVVIESTLPLTYQLKRINQVIAFTIYKAVPNMYCDTLAVYDGLVNEIAVQPEENNCVTVYITLNHQASCAVTSVAGLPARTVLSFDRSCLEELFSERRIVIDAGHGGRDTGGCGPVDLLEKNVVLTMAQRLKNHLVQVGAQIWLTREGDQDLPPLERLNLAREKRAHVFLSFHTNYNKDSRVGGLAINYNPAHSAGPRLARLTCEELVRKIRRDVLEIKADKELSALGPIPGLKIKPVTISNWVEEGLLRNPTSYDKIALGVLNGLRRYFSNYRTSA
ncbi:MAG: N-acetylmuramoyl-L-alanine amidase [Bacillota bacterium]